MLEASMDSVLEQVERKLNVASLNDFDEERLRLDIIPDAAASLSFDLGMTAQEAAFFNWGAASRERTLLVNLCFYEWNHAAEQFSVDFADEIAKCRDLRLAMQHAEAADEN